MGKKKEVYVLVFLIVLLFVINYNFLDSMLEETFYEGEEVFIERVIDGDTIVSNGTSIRLLGINTPERGERYYSEAKGFLETIVLNKTVRLEYGKEKYDKYGRILAYVFLNKENVNLRLVREGFGNFYFPSGKDRYYSVFVRAWGDCLDEEKNLCEFSENVCSDCVKLKNFDYENQRVILENNCGKDCDLDFWEIKDEGRKKFVFDDFVLEKNSEVEILVGEGADSKDVLYWRGEDYVWTKTGDSLFLRDSSGKLVLWEGY